ncbi:MAG: filamentous hemagglutinin N-terminal domain-containing protein [Hydrococcus sp. Prado102]|nr:filamentous hemagglutinin N-terminal domain-containing protein [Hydrococcus sp. Prado102]
MRTTNPIIVVKAALLFGCVVSEVATAQIIPDETLPTNSTVIRDGNTLTLDGGTTAGDNLFHSFEHFSVPTGNTAYFNNPLNLQNIFSRVTGGTVSQIDGLIRANGTANLFFINPNGLVFGSNAALDIGGSFLGTTAGSIFFADGFQFSAINPSTSPLLTVSSPIGLDFGSNPGTISVRGTGHSLVFAAEPNGSFASIASPFLGAGQSTVGLRTASGKTLALIGGSVNFDGGILTAPSGKIELGSVAEGVVGLNLTSTGLSFQYSEASGFQDIKLSNKSLLDASGFFNGQINLQGRNLFLNDGATILISNFGSFPSGTVNIEVVDSVILNENVSPEIRNLSNSNNLIRGIYSQNFSTGKGADIVISANNLTLQNFSTISTASFSTGSGGNVELNVQDLTVNGKPPLERIFLPSSINTLAVNSGRAGDIQLLGKSLNLQDGGLIISQTLGLGAGGNITIDAVENLKITGGFFLDPDSFIGSALGTTTLTFGNGGNVLVNTEQLKLEEGGRVNATTTGLGRAGDITINARHSIEVSGQVLDSTNLIGKSQIVASGDLVNPFLARFFGLPDKPQGESGSVTLDTERLTVREGGLISVRNDGTGNAGEININASLISLENVGSISASTQAGEGGNIGINSKDIRLTNGSEMSATAGGTSNSGNISINTDSLLLRDNNSITANAMVGKGGNVQINAQALFVSPDSRITASSQLGVDGVVDISTPDTNLQSALNPLSVELMIPESILEGSCLSNTRGFARLRNAGTGSLASSPEFSEDLSSLSSVPSPQTIENSAANESVSLGITFKEFVPWQPGVPMINSTRIIQLPDGRIVSVADISVKPEQVKQLLCAAEK